MNVVEAIRERLGEPAIDLRMADPFERHWKRCLPWLQDAYDRGPQLWSLDAIKARAGKQGSGVYFWHAPRAAVVGEIVQGDTVRWFNFWLLGGDLEELLQMRPKIEEWAKAQGCTRILSEGRPGWERVLKPHGYRVAGVVFTKELS